VDRFLAGRGWLEEATLVAQSETVRLRAFQELAARQTVEQRIAAANKVLDEAAQRCGSAESVAALAQWRQELDGLSQAFQERREREEALIREAYAQRLRTRYQRALDRGDSQAAARYQDLLAEGEDNK
jgi:hypothetical protein